MTYNRLVVWIRKEFRVHDHAALWHACRDAGDVIPLVIVDEEWPVKAPAKQKVLADAVRDFRDDIASLGGMLIVRHGNPAAVLHRVITETNAAGVYCTGSIEPGNRLRDEVIRRELESTGKVWVTFNDSVIMGERDLLTSAQSEPYVVFTPYRNAWQSRLLEIRPPLPAPETVRVPTIDSDELPLTMDAVTPVVGTAANTGGRKAAIALLDRFIGNGLASYHVQRDYPGLDGTSRLSIHLATGTVSPVEVFHAIVMAGRRRQGAEIFLTQLIWREFYYQIMANFPHVATRSFREEYDDIRWKSSAGMLEAWCFGQTGYPFVDAAMRQLRKEGWMHNRGRMVAAGFLAKDLHINWREGEQYFMSLLADGDLPLNNGGWQWCAGTGTDAQPWFRIFNPVLQSKKFDPTGRYIRRYIPELTNVPDRYIHEPWNMPAGTQDAAGCRIGRDYPKPVVAHDVERATTLKLYSAVKQQGTGRTHERRPALRNDERSQPGGIRRGRSGSPL